jgi:hypothetical protein
MIMIGYGVIMGGGQLLIAPSKMIITAGGLIDASRNLVLGFGRSTDHGQVPAAWQRVELGYWASGWDIGSLRQRPGINCPIH